MWEAGINDIVAVGSAAIALISFVFNWAVVSRQMAMQAESLKAQMDSDLVAWAKEAIDALSEGAALARGRGVRLSEEALRNEAAIVASRLSAIADKGRLYFPNLAPHAAGADREAAFRGYRPPIIDALIFGFYKLDRLDPRNLGPDEDTAAFLSRCRRLVVSEVQQAVDPRRRGRMLKRLSLGAGKRDAAGFRVAASLAEELERAHPGILEAKRDAAWVSEMERRAKAH